MIHMSENWHSNVMIHNFNPIYCKRRKKITSQNFIELFTSVFEKLPNLSDFYIPF